MTYHITGTDYDLVAYEGANGWQATGYVADSEIDTAWAGLEGLTFEELDSLVLDVFANEI